MADEQYKVRSGPNGPLYFPSNMSDDAIDKVMKDQSDTISKLPSLQATGQDKTVGKIAPVQPTSQVPPGWLRTGGIVGGQFARGLVEPVAIPGDLLAIGREVAAMPPEMAPWTYKFPTTQSLDKGWFGGLTPPELTPQTTGERTLAGASRGAGEAVTAFGPGALGRTGRLVTGMPNFPLSSYGNLPTNLLTGSAAGAASNLTAADYPPLDPTKSSSLAPAAPVVAGTLAGLATGSTSEGVRGAYNYFTGAANAPYNAVLRNYGANLATGAPHIEDAGNDLQAAVRAAGPRGTALSRRDYNALTGRNVDGVSVYNRVLDGQRPNVAITLRDEFPDEMDQLTGAHLANRGTWNLHPRIQESLIPDPLHRGIMNESFAGGVLPVPFAGASMQDIEQRILRGVRSEAAGAIGGSIGEMARSDPSLAGSMRLLGAIIPYVGPTVRAIARSPTARQGVIGGAIGVGPGTELIPPSMQYQAPGNFNPPQGQGQ